MDTDKISPGQLGEACMLDRPHWRHVGGCVYMWVEGAQAAALQHFVGNTCMVPARIVLYSCTPFRQSPEAQWAAC